MGDFNYPNVKWDGTWTGEKNEEIVTNIADAFLLQQVVGCTRRRSGQNPTLDDWVLVSHDNLISDIVHLDPVGKSDHDVLKFEMNVSMKGDCKQKKQVYNLSKGNYGKLRELVKEHDWSLFNKMDVNEAWCYMRDMLHNAMEQCIPKVNTGPSKSIKPVWMDKKALNKVKKKYKLFKRYLKTKSGVDYEKYIRERNACNRILKKARREYEKSVAKECKLNPKKFWKYVQGRLKVNTGISPLKQPDGSFAVDDQGKAETLNLFFSSVFTQEDTSNLPNLNDGEYSEGSYLNEIRVTPQAVEAKLKDLNVNKSKGPDKIPPRVLKEVSNELCVPLSALFNKSLESGILPEDWKTAEVTAIFKKGSKQDPGNYRPVSLTCIICKVLESVIRDALVNFFLDNNLYTDCQHGFRKKRSCVTHLLEVMEDFTMLMEQRQDIDVIYCDFKKAFDTVPHERLLIKLAAYGVVGGTLAWIKSFLNGRSQHVQVGTAKSNKVSVLSGIPQGSILGPILFTVFINDLPDALKCTCKIFADDTKLYGNAKDNEELQHDITKLEQWCETWNLYFNVSKCGVLHIGKTNPKHDYEMIVNGMSQSINKVDEEKDLGVTFDCQLSFDPHIHRVVSKANQILGMIKRSFTFLDKDTFLKLYKAFVRPHIEYANVIWNPYLKRQSTKIESVQRRATKILNECKSMTYNERLIHLKLYSLKGRRIRGDLIQMYKICNGLDDLSVDKFFLPSPSEITRNSVGKLFVKQCSLNKRKYTFSHRVVTNWNALNTNIKFSKSINEFKNSLDNFSKISDLFYEFDEK
jgi:hypothetical protein